MFQVNPDTIFVCNHGHLPWMCQPDKILDSFESDPPLYSTWTRGKATSKLTARIGYAKEGARSLLVELEPTGDKKGRHALNVVWRFDPPTDWSAYDGLIMWYQSQDGGSPGFTVSVTEEGGANYWQHVQPKPRLAGKWQVIELKHKAWQWSWEGPEELHIS